MRRKNSRQTQDNNVTLVLIVVVIVFIICQTPALVTQIQTGLSRRPRPSRRRTPFHLVLHPPVVATAVSFVVLSLAYSGAFVLVRHQ